MVDACHWTLCFTIQVIYRQLYLDVKCAYQPGATSSTTCGTQEEAPPADPWAEEGAWLKRLVTCLPTSYKLLWVVHLHVPPKQQKITCSIIPLNIFEILITKMEIDTCIENVLFPLFWTQSTLWKVPQVSTGSFPLEGQIEAAPEAHLQPHGGSRGYHECRYLWIFKWF